METSEIRKEIHEEIDRMLDCDVIALKEFLTTFPTPVNAAFRNAPLDDEPLTEEEICLIREAEEWLEHNEGIPHEEVMRELGLE